MQKQQRGKTLVNRCESRYERMDEMLKEAWEDQKEVWQFVKKNAIPISAGMVTFFVVASILGNTDYLSYDRNTAIALFFVAVFSSMASGVFAGYITRTLMDIRDAVVVAQTNTEQAPEPTQTEDAVAQEPTS